PRAGVQRNLTSVLEADSPAVEQCRRIAAGPSSEIEDALVLQEEIALLRKEEAEAGEVDLLLIRFDLCEVGVVGQVGGEPARHAHLYVETAIAAECVGR